MGYDTLFFTGDDDWQMVITALNEGRIILTRDTQIMNRGVITGGRLKAVLIHSDKPEKQIKQVVDELKLDITQDLFSRCLECNQLLGKRTREQVKGRVPDHVFRTMDRYMECPACHRIFWKGTHWQAMNVTLEKLRQD